MTFKTFSFFNFHTQIKNILNEILLGKFLDASTIRQIFLEFFDKSCRRYSKNSCFDTLVKRRYHDARIRFALALRTDCCIHNARHGDQNMF